MPRLVGNNSGDDAGMQTYQIGGSNFTFQATRIGGLGASGYTLVTIVVDTTGSTSGFTQQLREMLLTVIAACQKNARKEFLLVRVIVFSTSYNNGHEELHGFTRVLEINTSDYPTIHASGATPLWDATFSGVGAMAEYAEDLTSQDFDVNGILFVITDGVEGDWSGNPVSTVRPAEIKAKLAKITTGELMESMLAILIGINADHCRSELEQFRVDAGFDQYTDAGNATPDSLAKLAAFVEFSISSQSQALGTGGPSQSIPATI
ncbi:MAG TPA: hypothetical protein VJM32_06240 [Candidatus Saccharimonadales bacterium]|nr:hypothetical protein [Candidatus Saccharimonadales bacterium]